MREIILDTETTGLDPKQGHRVIEIGCIELINYVPTGKTFHVYINPERDVPTDAEAVHGISTKFLADKPLFAAIADDFLAFVGDSPLVIHNAPFDIGFLNTELARLNKPGFAMEQVIDTLTMARSKFPGSPASLDALCKRFGIDNTNRTVHGALLDSALLAEVYLELRGGRQQSLVVEPQKKSKTAPIEIKRDRSFRAARTVTPDPAELEAHNKLIDKIPNALWRRIG